MKAILAAACAVLLSMGTPAFAHQLDEYLQATTISVERSSIRAQMRLTPGVAVFSKVLAVIDTNGDGALSETEQKAYAERALRDLSLTMDGNCLPLSLVSWKFAKTTEMKAGRGDIQLEFRAEAPRSGHNRTLIFENHHQSRIAAYMVNCLVPPDPDIQITEQKRNYLQSRYELDYVQTGVPAVPQALARRPGAGAWLCTSALLLIVPFAWLGWRMRRQHGIAGEQEV